MRLRDRAGPMAMRKSATPLWAAILQSHTELTVRVGGPADSEQPAPWPLPVSDH